MSQHSKKFLSLSARAIFKNGSSPLSPSLSMQMRRHASTETATKTTSTISTPPPSTSKQISTTPSKQSQRQKEVALARKKNASDMLAKWHENQFDFRPTQFLEVVLPTLLRRSSTAEQEQQLLSVVSKTDFMLHKKEDLLKIAMRHHKGVLDKNEVFNVLLVMNGQSPVTASPLTDAWTHVMQKNHESDADTLYKLFEKAKVELKADNEVAHQWLQVLSFAGGNLQRVREITEKLRKSLQTQFQNKDRNDPTVRRNYFGHLQRISKYEFDMLYEACTRTLDMLNPKAEPFKPLSNAAFEQWYKYTTSTFFFKSLRYSKTRDLRKQQKYSGADEAVQVYYQDLVPSTHVYTKSIILLSKFQHWEEAAYLYQEALQRPIGMRPVTLFSDPYYEVIPHIRRYIEWGHVNPLQFNLGKMLDHGRVYRRRVLEELTEMMSSGSTEELAAVTAGSAAPEKVEAV